MLDTIFKNMDKDEECEEWAVFHALCPWELMQIIEELPQSRKNRESVIQMFENLGFESLSELFIALFCFQYDGIESAEQGYTENELIAMFLKGITSQGLRDLFEKRADYMSDSHYTE